MTELESVLLSLAPETTAVLDKVTPPHGQIAVDIARAKLAVERARVVLIRRRLTALVKAYGTELTAAFAEDMVDAMFPTDDDIDAYLDAYLDE